MYLEQVNAVLQLLKTAKLDEFISSVAEKDFEHRNIEEENFVKSVIDWSIEQKGSHALKIADLIERRNSMKFAQILEYILVWVYDNLNERGQLLMKSKFSVEDMLDECYDGSMFAIDLDEDDYIAEESSS